METEGIRTEAKLVAEDFDLKEVRAIKAVHAMFKKHLTGIQEFVVLTGYDKYPQFLLGQAKSKRWLGLATYSLNPYIYENDF
jgi:hypothetical protein